MALTKVSGGLLGNLSVGTDNVALGNTALDSVTSGTNNTAIGSNALTALTTASNNTAIGLDALVANTGSNFNVAIGNYSLDAQVSGGRNVGIGYNAIGSDTTGARSTAVGWGALANQNFTGSEASFNVAVGYNCLQTNTTGQYNSALGYQTSFSNISGSNNISVGYQSLYENTTGGTNTVLGSTAGYSNATGSANVFIGSRAGYSSTASFNTFVGTDAGRFSTGTQNTFVGCSDAVAGSCGELMTTGNKNTIIGAFNGNKGGLDIRTSSNNIVLSDGDGNPRFHINSTGHFKANPNGARDKVAQIHEIGHDGTDEILYIESGNTSYNNVICTVLANRNTTNNNFYAYRYFNDAANAAKFLVADSGNVTNTNNSYGAISDVKLKQDIVDAGSQWEDIKNLQVRKYRWKAEPNGPLQLGLVAQEVEAVSAGLVETHNDRGRDGTELGTTTKSVKYSILYMKAVKALQEAMERIEELEARVTTLEG